MLWTVSRKDFTCVIRGRTSNLGPKNGYPPCEYLLVSHGDAEEDDADDGANQHDEACEQTLVGRVTVCMYDQTAVRSVAIRCLAGAVILRALADVLPDDEQDTYCNDGHRQRVIHRAARICSLFGWYLIWMSKFLGNTWFLSVILWLYPVRIHFLYPSHPNGRTRYLT